MVGRRWPTLLIAKDASSGKGRESDVRSLDCERGLLFGRTVAHRSRELDDFDRSDAFVDEENPPVRQQQQQQRPPSTSEYRRLPCSSLPLVPSSPVVPSHNRLGHNTNVSTSSPNHSIPPPPVPYALSVAPSSNPAWTRTSNHEAPRYRPATSRPPWS
ncbi:hypothetical protein EJ06DRAFT_522973 [Trichodelitschia bisporula]|uniref:Uncharacterized protein n=1 Tax=Trichodelitschia bisporula TaxID=703511 RepID=A0A6G1HRR2_9PEZI|nr:hypothetical protein EJ06DRAFT_522973 [Trichodelitschia bisporula]